MSSRAQIGQRGPGDQGPPRLLLVIAGNSRQFEVWRQTQPAERGRRARYIQDPRQTRGYGPEHIDDVVLTGEWWLSPVYRDESAWGPLVRLKEAVSEGRTGWLNWTGQTAEEAALFAAHRERTDDRVHGSGRAQIKAGVRFSVEGVIEERRAPMTRPWGSSRSGKARRAASSVIR